MKIPKTLKIGGHVVRIDCSKVLEDENGHASLQENTIRVCASLPKSQKEATLVHEIFHFLNTTLDEGDGHRLLDSLSEQLYQVLSDNRMLR